VTWNHAANLRRWQPRNRLETPDELFNELDKEFHFTIDLCAHADNAKCPVFYTEKDNALWQPWTGTCWCNPPWSDVKPWVLKAHEAAQAGATVVMLLPVRSDLSYWHTVLLPHAEIRFLQGRTTFKGERGRAPLPLAIAILRPPLPLEHLPPSQNHH
jgi:site-specific DNA-methyltransferase (adenine-specific)